MIKIKVLVDFEEGENYSLAHEIEVGLTDEAIAEIAKAIKSVQQVDRRILSNCPPHVASPNGRYCIDCGIMLDSH